MQCCFVQRQGVLSTRRILPAAKTPWHTNRRRDKHALSRAREGGREGEREREGGGRRERGRGAEIEINREGKGEGVRGERDGEEGR